MIGGRLYGVPVLGVYTALYYSTTSWQKHGITPPATWDELIACAALQAKRVVPLICRFQDVSIPGFTYMLIASGILGADGFAALRKGKRKLTDPDLLPARPSATCIASISPARSARPTPRARRFALGRGAMMVAGSADYAGSPPPAKVNFGVVPFPTPPSAFHATVWNAGHLQHQCQDQVDGSGADLPAMDAAQGGNNT